MKKRAGTCKDKKKRERKIRQIGYTGGEKKGVKKISVGGKIKGERPPEKVPTTPPLTVFFKTMPDTKMVGRNWSKKKSIGARLLGGEERSYSPPRKR